MKKILLTLLTLTLFFLLFSAQTRITVSAAENSSSDETTIKVSAKNGSDISDKLREALINARDLAESSGQIITVKVKKGDYYLSKSLHIYSNTTLDVTDVHFTYQGTKKINMVISGTNAPYRGYEHFNSSEGCSGYDAFENITVLGGIWESTPENAGSMIRLFHARNVTLDGLTLIGGGCVHQMEVAAIDGFYVRNCTFLDHGKSADSTTNFQKQESIQLDMPYSNLVLFGGNFMKKLTLIIPCYNEADALPLFAAELNKVIVQLTNYNTEVLLVNDGSSDQTLTVMKEICASDSHYKYISFSRNFGKEAAMYAGFCNSDGDYAAVMDADMQDPPSLLPEMLNCLETEDYDSVATRRVSRIGEPPIRSFFAKKFYKLINKISDADIVDGARDFRLMRKEMVDSIVSMCEYNRFSKGIFGWIGFKTKWIQYENVNRIAGETKWNFWGLVKYAIDGIINFSETPMSFASGLGIFLTIFSFIMVIFIIIRKAIFGDPVAGWPSLACIIIFIAGLQFLCMGIMGKYMAKTYLEVKNRPHYIISETNKEHVDHIN